MNRTNYIRHGIYTTIKVIPSPSFLRPSGLLKRQSGGCVGAEKGGGGMLLLVEVETSMHGYGVPLASKL